MPSTPSPPYDRPTYFAAVAAGIGTEASPWREAYFIEWARWEGFEAQGGPHYNPLATTLPGGENPAEPWWNTFTDAEGRVYHVMNYASFAIGVQKTVQTLQNGRYPAILAALRREEIGELRDDAVAQTRTWGTTGFANLLAEGWDPPVEPGPGPEPRPKPETLEETIERLMALEAYVLELNAATVARFDLIELAGHDYAEVQRAVALLRSARPPLLREEQ